MSAPNSKEFADRLFSALRMETPPEEDIGRDNSSYIVKLRGELRLVIFARYGRESYKYENGLRIEPYSEELKYGKPSFIGEELLPEYLLKRDIQDWSHEDFLTVGSILLRNKDFMDMFQSITPYGRRLA